MNADEKEGLAGAVKCEVGGPHTKTQDVRSNRRGEACLARHCGMLKAAIQ